MMLRKIGIILFISVMWIAAPISCKAEASQEIVLSEENQYDPKYYGPLTDNKTGRHTRATGKSTQLEQVIVAALLNGQTEIDVSAYVTEEDGLADTYIKILNDHPELFYVRKSVSIYISNGEEYLISPTYLYSIAEANKMRKQMDAIADEAVSLITEDMEDYEKALIIHDWLASHCEYDKENYYAGTIPKDSYTAYGALVKGVAVCQGYAEAYLYIMRDKLGIPGYLISSNAMNHVWNIVEIEGKYYHVDVTWDDPTWDCIGRATHSNLLVNNLGIQATGHILEETVAATDRTYINALWRKSSSRIIYHKGYYYYMDDDERCLRKTDNIWNGVPKTLYEFERWNENAFSYWIGCYSYPYQYKDMIIFNGTKQIYSMPFDTEKVSVLYTPEDIPEDKNYIVYNIFGFCVRGEEMFYAVQSTPNINIPQREYIKSLTIPFIGHNPEVRDVKEASCTEDGYTGDTYCKDCGEKLLEGEVIKASGHDIEVRGYVAADTEKEGYTGDSYCKTCGMLVSKGEKIPIKDTLSDSSSDDIFDIPEAPDDSEEESDNVPDKTEEAVFHVGDTFTVNAITYKVAAVGNQNNVSALRVSGNPKNISIPGAVKKGGISFKVTSIYRGAFKNKSNITKVVIGKNITAIDNNAFSGCKKLKKIKIISKKIKSVGKNAIKNIHRKAVIECPSNQVKKYKKLFKAGTGYKKTMKIRK